MTLSLRGSVWNSILATCAAAAEHYFFRFHTFFRPHPTLHQHTRPRSHRIMISVARQTFSMAMFALRVHLCNAA